MIRSRDTDKAWRALLALLFVLLIALLGIVFGVQNMGQINALTDIITLYLPPPPRAATALVTTAAGSPQLVDGAHLWTTVRYNQQLFFSPAWSWSPAQNDTLLCNTPGLYEIYASLQTQQLNRSSLHPNCSACRLRYALRATLQTNGVGPLVEVQASLTEISRDVSFLAKSFLLQAQQGDVLRVQFSSPCASLALATTSNSSFNSFPTSATLTVT